MGKVTVAIGQGDITVARSIARDTLKHIIQKTGYPEDYTILFSDESVDSPSQTKNFFNKCLDDGGVRTHYANYIFVEYKDTFTEHGSVQSKGLNDHPYIFNDEKLGVAIRPEYARAKIEFSIRFRFNDYTVLQGWVNALRLTEGLKNLHHGVDVRYDYSIPYPFLEFMYFAHELREKQEGYGESLATWIKNNKSKAMQTRTNANASYTEVIANEQQLNCHGTVNENLFYNTREIQQGVHEVVMEYTLNYSRIIGCTLFFPAIIHNQFIPREFVDAFIKRHPWYDSSKHVKPLSYLNDYVTPATIDRFYLGDGGSRMVEWDDWFPADAPNNRQTVSLFPIRVNFNDPYDVVNLNDIPDMYVPKAIKDYLKKYGHLHNEMNKCLVQIEVYAVNETETIRIVNIDQNLAIRTTKPLSVRDRNYVRVTLMRDPAKLSPIQTRELLKDPILFFPILKLYDPETTVINNSDQWADTITDLINAHTKPSALTLTTEWKVTTDSNINVLAIVPDLDSAATGFTDEVGNWVSSKPGNKVKPAEQPVYSPNKLPDFMTSKPSLISEEPIDTRSFKPVPTNQLPDKEYIPHSGWSMDEGIYYEAKPIILVPQSEGNDAPISEDSYFTWLKQQKTTNNWFANLRPTTALTVGSYSFTIGRR